MKLKVKSQKRKFYILNSSFWLLASSIWLLPSFLLPLKARSTQSSVLIAQSSSCLEKDVQTLTDELLKDLPSYANRTTQRARRQNRIIDIYSYVLVAGRPEFAPLTLGPGEYTSADSTANSQEIEQVFITTLERQYTAKKAVELQQYHWLFLTRTSSGWQLAMMFSRTGTYPDKRPPTPPRDSSDGVIGQAIRTWLRDCQAGTVKNKE